MHVLLVLSGLFGLSGLLGDILTAPSESALVVASLAGSAEASGPGVAEVEGPWALSPLPNC